MRYLHICNGCNAELESYQDYGAVCPRCGSADTKLIEEIE